MRRRKTVQSVKILLICLGAFLLLHQGAGEVSAKKIRFNVGFTADQTLENIRASEAWQYTEMGCAWWPMIYDQLWAMGPAPGYKAVPRLATSWETKDRQTWIFHLRKDGVFHDGKPVTAHDVVWTVTNLPANVASFEAPDRDFKEIKALDDYTVKLVLKNVLGGEYPPIYWMPILPKHIWAGKEKTMAEFANSKAIGSGPYKLKEFKAKEYVWMVANDKFWGGKPAIDELVYKAYGSAEALNLALKKGKVEMIGYTGIMPLNVPDFEGQKNIKIIKSPGIGLIWLTFNLHKKTPIQDLVVRKAIMHGSDYGRIIKIVYRGYAQKADSFIYPERPDYNKNLPKYNYDPAKAKKLLQDAGYKDTDGNGLVNDPKTGKDLNFELMVPSDWSTEVKFSTLLKESLAKVGIGMSLKVLDLDTYYSFIYEPSGDKWDVAVGEEEPGPYADWIWEMSRSWDGGGEGWNQAYYNNPEFDKVLNAYRSAIDPAKRIELSQKLQLMISQDLPYGIILRPSMIDPVRTDKFTGYQATMGGVITWINPWTIWGIKPVK